MTASLYRTIESADAVELLYAGHERIRHFIEEFRSAHAGEAPRQAAAYVRRLCREVAIHSTVEEEIFYPEVRALIGDSELVGTARQEHEWFHALAAELAAGTLTGAPRLEQAARLCDALIEHMREEEQQMFSRARVAELDMYEIGARIRARELDLRLESRAGEAWRVRSVTVRNAGMWRSAG